MTHGASALVAGANNVASRRHGFWDGPDWLEAERVFELCVTAGMTTKRAFMLAHVASWKDAWGFAKHFAERAGGSVRTFFRMLAEAKAKGFARTARAKKNEVPPGGGGPLVCGWSHRWIIGRGLTLEQRAPELHKARLRWMTHLAARKRKPRELIELAERKPQPRQAPRGMSKLDWLNAELAKLPKPPRDGPD